METLKDFISMRIKELEDSIVPLRQQHAETAARIAAMEKELSELQSAAKAIGMLNGLESVPLKVTRRSRPRVTIKEAVMAVLQDFPQGLIALDLLSKINERFALDL